MMEGLLQQEVVNLNKESRRKNHQFWSSSSSLMELPELSLAPTLRRVLINKSASSSSSAESETNSSSRKRKFFSNNNHLFKTEETSTTRPTSFHHASVDLQLKDPLPLDWEQCLDLQSGRMYYLNRRTLRKSWERPKDHDNLHRNSHKLDLELNISPLSSAHSKDRFIGSNSFIKDTKMINNSSSSGSTSSSSSTNNMVALACLNCHLLVILSKSSPSCPNCKYVHSLPAQHHVSVSSSQVLQKNNNVKCLHTLSLLN